MISLSIFILGLMLLASFAHGKVIYGIVTHFAADRTETSVSTVQAFQNGSLTHVVENFRYVGGSIAYEGISTFDQKNKVLYYAVNFESAFVYAIDVRNRAVLPPVSIGATWVVSLIHDERNDAIYAEAIYQHEQTEELSFALVSFSTDGKAPVRIVANLTATLGVISETALDSSNGVYYMIYTNSTTRTRYLGSFSVSSDFAATFSSSELDCGGYAVQFLSFDPTTEQLVGVGVASRQYSFIWLDPSTRRCSASPLEIKGIVTSAAFDPYSSTMHIGVAPNGSPLLYTYHLATRSLEFVVTDSVLEDLQISF